MSSPTMHIDMVRPEASPYFCDDGFSQTMQFPAIKRRQTHLRIATDQFPAVTRTLPPPPMPVTQSRFKAMFGWMVTLWGVLTIFWIMMQPCVSFVVTTLLSIPAPYKNPELIRLIITYDILLTFITFCVVAYKFWPRVFYAIGVLVTIYTFACMSVEVYRLTGFVEQHIIPLTFK